MNVNLTQLSSSLRFIVASMSSGRLPWTSIAPFKILFCESIVRPTAIIQSGSEFFSRFWSMSFLIGHELWVRRSLWKELSRLGSLVAAQGLELPSCARARRRRAIPRACCPRPHGGLELSLFSHLSWWRPGCYASASRQRRTAPSRSAGDRNSS